MPFYLGVRIISTYSFELSVASNRFMALDYLTTTKLFCNAKKKVSKTLRNNFHLILGCHNLSICKILNLRTGLTRMTDGQYTR